MYINLIKIRSLICSDKFNAATLSDLQFAPTNSMSPDIKFVKADQRFDFHYIDVFMKYNVSQIIPRKGIYLWINSSDTSSILDAKFNFSWMH